MQNFLIHLLGVLVATNQAVAASNLVANTTGIHVAVADPQDPVEKEYLQILMEDDAAEEEVDNWITDNEKFKAKGAGIEEATLRARIHERMDQVKQRYESFIKEHPNHAKIRLAYGSFLSDIADEDGALEQWKKAAELDPSNPAAWNNLANYYGHNGGVTNSFAYYARAIALDSSQPVYYHNLATTVYLFRRDAMKFYHLTEPQVFAKAMALYKKAQALDPHNFLLATDIAQSYYGIILPKRADHNEEEKTLQEWTDEALAAWKVAYDLARDDVERQGIELHFARVNIRAGRFDAARSHLAAVTNSMFSSTKDLLLKKLKGNSAPNGQRSEDPAASPSNSP